MQQALSADIAPATAPKQHAFLERQTGSLGSGQGSGPGSRVASEAENVREEDTGFWDLVYILYPDFAEAADSHGQHTALTQSTVTDGCFCSRHGVNSWCCFKLLLREACGSCLCLLPCELLDCWNVWTQARYAWAAPAFNPNASSTSSSGLLASLKDKVKRIR